MVSGKPELQKKVAYSASKQWSKDFKILRVLFSPWIFGKFRVNYRTCYSAKFLVLNNLLRTGPIHILTGDAEADPGNTNVAASETGNGEAAGSLGTKTRAEARLDLGLGHVPGAGVGVEPGPGVEARPTGKMTGRGKGQTRRKAAHVRTKGTKSNFRTLLSDL